MKLLKRRNDAAGFDRLRYTDEWIGAVVLLALAIFVGAVLEAGVVRRWLRPDAQLRIVLPQSGFGGLAVGADVDVLGTHAGTVRDIQVNPDGEMSALATIEYQTKPFIKRDSKALIRLRYAVAGSAYVDISRGTGADMDWNYAVLTATVEPNPADALTQTAKDVSARVVPILDNALHATQSLDEIMAGIKAGQGSAGRLLVDDTLIRQVEDTVGALKDQIAKLSPIMAGVPGLLGQTRDALGNVQSVTKDVARATPQLPTLARNATESTSNLPALLTQAQATMAELERLLAQLRGSWLLGGGGGPPPRPGVARLPPRDVRP